MLTNYANLSGNSNVVAYEVLVDAVRVQFGDGSIYVYNYASAGRDKIEQMKVLAENGRGLNSFIQKHVRKKYAYEE